MHNVLIIIGAVVIAVSAYLLYGGFVMISQMTQYSCMGMMCGTMVYYPLLLPALLMVIGILLVLAPLVILKSHSTNSLVSQANGHGSTYSGEINDQYGSILRLLPKSERDVLKYIIDSGGEAYQYQIMRELNLSKVRAWRIVRRLEEKGLVKVVKVKGRNLVKLKNFDREIN